MPWCDHCRKKTLTVHDDDAGYKCCSVCGRVIDQEVFSAAATFYVDAGGQSRMSGNFVKSVESNCSQSYERTVNKAREEIYDMATSLQIGGGASVIDEAEGYYKIALNRNFTRGRRTSQVAAACLYITCRINEKPYLLIDFSLYLQINVYQLGAVFLQLCQLLRLEQHDFVQKLVDPTLFVHRFTERLLGKKSQEVSNTALRIIASMKKDWMQTGRKPSGLCGAALYISALSHGLEYSKADIVRIVHICEATLTKRLIEFENTESGSLTIEELNMKAEEYIREPNLATKSPETQKLLCEHKNAKKIPHVAHGLCKACYDYFIKLSGGLQGGSDPPAFQLAERERMAKASAETNAMKSSVSSPKETQDAVEKVTLSHESSPHIGTQEGATTGHQEAVEEGASDQPRCDEDMDTIAGDVSESLSDIDDDEVEGYLHNEEEKHFKKIIWEEMNKEYIEEQAAKAAAAASAKQNCSLEAQELYEAATAAVAKSRKERQQKRAADAKNAAPAQTPAEATRQMLTKKRLSSRINYDVLDKLFDDSTTGEAIKKKRTEYDKGNIPANMEVRDEEEEVESGLVDNEDYEEDGNGGTYDYYGDESTYYGNEQGWYGGYDDEDYNYDP